MTEFPGSCSRLIDSPTDIRADCIPFFDMNRGLSLEIVVRGFTGKARITSDVAPRTAMQAERALVKKVEDVEPVHITPVKLLGP